MSNFKWKDKCKDEKRAFIVAGIIQVLNMIVILALILGVNE